MKNKEWKEMDKTAQNMKVEIESIKKTQTEENQEIKKFRTLNRNLRGKPYQQNARDGRQNFRH